MAGAGGGFAGGFLKGFGGQLLENRDRRDRLEREQRERDFRYGIAMLPHALKNSETEADLMAVIQKIDPDFRKNIKKGEDDGWFGRIKEFVVGPKQHSGTGQQPMDEVPRPNAGGPDVRGAELFQRAPQPMMQGRVTTDESPATPVIPGDILGSTPATAPQPPPVTATSILQPRPQTPKRTSVMGVELGTQEEKALRRGERLRAVMKNMREQGTPITLDQAAALLQFDNFPRDYASTVAGRPQSISGEVIGPDGKKTRAFGVFTGGAYRYPEGHELAGQPIPGFQPRSMGLESGTPQGVIGNRAAEKLGFRNAVEAIDAGVDLQPTIEEILRTDALNRGLGSGQAKVATEAGTKASELEQFSTQVDDIERRISDVFPDVGPGLGNAIKSRLSIAWQKFSNDQDYAGLESATQLALGQVAQLGGQKGVLSDVDIELARDAMAHITPSLYNGDTRQSALARIGVLRDLIATAKARQAGRAAVGGAQPPAAGTPPPPARTGGPPPPAKTGGPSAFGITVKDGVTYVNGKAVRGTPPIR